MIMKKFWKYFSNEIIFVFSIILIFVLVAVLMTTYDEINGAHNIFFDNYKLIWYDGRSPANFHLILNFMQNKSFSFPEGYLLNNHKIENDYDFKKFGTRYYPIFDIFPTLIYSFILSPFQFQSQLALFKAILIINLALSSISLVIFYFIQRFLGLNKIFSCFSTLATGLSTSTIIYFKYLFLIEIFSTTVFLILLYTILKNWKNPSRRSDIKICILLSLFVFSFHPRVLFSIVFFLAIFFINLKYKFLKSNLILILFLIATILLVRFHNNILKPYYTAEPEMPGESIIKEGMFRIFPKYINAIDYSIYGYNNISDFWKTNRQYSYIYGFSEERGNAIFVFSHSIFDALFGPKGFVFNSPFLIFSILGLFTYKDWQKRNFLFIIITFFILTYSLRFLWYGGVTPRYIRGFNMPILLLSFFSFYYIQENKNIFVRLIFILLVVISTLNVVSLAIRADWTYEHEADLVSYDWVLWPFIPSSAQKENLSNSIELMLTSFGEQSKWLFDGNYGCRAVGERGIKTDPCDCKATSWAERTVAVPWNRTKLTVEACADIAGNDGTEGKIYINDKLNTISINSYSCEVKSYIFEGNSAKVRLESSQNGICSGEMAFWKKITLEEQKD